MKSTTVAASLLPAIAGALLLWAGALVPPAAAQMPFLGGDARPAAAQAPPSAQPHAPADIPARADADTQFVKAVTDRAEQAAVSAQRFEQTLAEHEAAVQQLAADLARSELNALSVRRLESLQRHWLLLDREIARARARLARVTQAIADDAAGVAERRAAWEATYEASGPGAAGSVPALLERVDELLAAMRSAEAALSAPLAKTIELGRRSSALATQVQSNAATVQAAVEDVDRSLWRMDLPPLWVSGTAIAESEPVREVLRRGLSIEQGFARDYDNVNASLWPVLGVLAVLTLPLMFWLKRRAAGMAATGQGGSGALQSLAHPWAAWLVLVALGAVLYDFQGPTFRLQVVKLLAWAPVLVLMQRKVRDVLGPWVYLSAGFYLLNVMASLLVGSPLLYRGVQMAITVLMLLSLGWLAMRARRAAAVAATAPGGSTAGPATSLDKATLPGRAARALHWAAFAVLGMSVISNAVGNVSLANMLTTAVLDSSYLALALYAGASVLVALFQVLLSRPMASWLQSRHVGSLIPVAARLGRTVLLLAWAVYTLQAFRIYRPLSELAVAVLGYELRTGFVTISLGRVVAFAAATWVAFWLARTIRLLLSQDVMPALSLPRGVGDSISTLTYYGIVVLGLLTALAMAGFQIGELAFVIGALSVGIGFGLQDIVKNFVAGLVLMFERPIRLGDLVDVAGQSGAVRDIGLRATTITTFDGAAVVVPNGMLLADSLVNWTLDGGSRRVHIDVSTGYGVSSQQTIALLETIARGTEGVAPFPRPDAILTGLTPGALTFSLRAWTMPQEIWVTVRSRLAVRIAAGLAEAGIEVPLPQREMHVRNAPDAAMATAAPKGSGTADKPPGG